MATIETQPSATAREAPVFSFENVSWDDYEAMLRIVGDRPIRIIYDRGRMELMSPTFGHDNTGYLLGRMVDALSEELDLPIEGGDTTTLRRKDLGRGTESDKCYWIGDRSEAVRGKTRLDLETDPPPNLVVEVDLTNPSIDKLPIFAALGITEVWRFDEDSLVFLILRPDGSYAESETSQLFPRLQRSVIADFLDQAKTMNKTAWIKAFRAAIREDQNTGNADLL